MFSPWGAMCQLIFDIHLNLMIWSLTSDKGRIWLKKKNKQVKSDCLHLSCHCIGYYQVYPRFSSEWFWIKDVSFYIKRSILKLCLLNSNYLFRKYFHHKSTQPLGFFLNLGGVKLTTKNNHPILLKYINVFFSYIYTK